MSNTMKIGTQTGSLFNHLMSNSRNVPEVGKGATVLLWTDRHAYEVIEVSEDKKKVVLERYKPIRSDNNGMSESQNYAYGKLIGYKMTLVYKWGAWRSVYSRIEFTKEARIIYDENIFEAYKQANGKYDENGFISTEIPGLTKKRTLYNIVNVIFGVKREYYDYSF